MTNGLELQSRCAYWLGRFGMAEWIGPRPKQPALPRVRVTVRSKKKMGDDVGSCAWHAEECTAEIELLRGQGEDTLVHEILHLVLEGHTTYADTKYSELHERALNRLAAGCLAEVPATLPDTSGITGKSFANIGRTTAIESDNGSRGSQQ